MRKIWNVKKCDAGQAAALAAETGISTLLAGVLLNRGIDNREKVEEFLHPEKWDYHDPYLLPDMAAAVKRIRQAIDSREQIVVYGDYDADGITATTVLLKCLKKWGLWWITIYQIDLPKAMALIRRLWKNCIIWEFL